MKNKKILGFELQNKLNILENENIKRNPVAAENGKAVFLKKAQELGTLVSQTENRRLNNQQKEKQLSNFSRRKEYSPMFSILTSILVALSVIIGGSGMTVAAAQSSLPDEPLYELKLFSEESLMTLTGDPESQLDLSLDFVDRRVEEIRDLIAQGDIPTEETQQRLFNQIEEAIFLATNLPEDQAFGALEEIQLRLLTQEELLVQTQNNGTDSALMIMSQTRATLQERVLAIENGKTNMFQLRQENQTQWSAETSPEPGLSTSETPDQLNATTDSTPLNNSPELSGSNPWTTGTPTPGSGYGPGDGTGDCTTCTPVQNNLTGTNRPTITITPRGNNQNNPGNQNGNH